MNEDRWQEVTIDERFDSDPRRWLAEQMSAGKPWLLAHADDGVIWGRLEEDGALLLSSDVFADPAIYPAVAVKLRTETLQQVRVFGPEGELLIWRHENGFAGRLVEDDGDPSEDDVYDEEHLLWALGRPRASQDDFTLLQEGQQGMMHAPPVVVAESQRPRLHVRHYVDYDEEGQAYVYLSRLVKLTNQGE